MRLLPPNHQLGLTPYLYLVYAVPFVLYPLRQNAAAWEPPAVGAGLAAFLAFYFRGFWIGEGRGMWGPVAGITLLGVLYLPINWGASSFYIYAAAFTSRLGSRRLAMGCLVALTALAAAVGWWWSLPIWAWLPAVVFVPIIGLLTQHDFEVQAKNRQLRRSGEEISRLARSAERERIGRDLHDLLGHTLSVITLKAELAAKLAERDAARAGREMREIEAISRDALKQVRRAVTAYRGESLATELAGAERSLAAAGVALEVDGRAPELDPARETVLALALREAVTNVIRHASARRCRIRFEPAEDGVRLLVRDDGVGGDGEEGSGLRGMRERLAQLGGRLERLTDGGTLLDISLPLGGAGAEP